MQIDQDLLIQYFQVDAPTCSSIKKDVSRDRLSQLKLDSLPKHISIIMDGNGRWAEAHGQDRTYGHKAGVASLRECVTTCVRLGIDVLSVYAFSTENWRRPQREVTLLMHLFATTLIHELPLFEQENVRLKFLGDLSALPQSTQRVFQEGLNKTKDNAGMIFALAVNYGARSEITRAARMCAQKVQDGLLDPQDITEETLEQCLYTSDLPDPDLLIRTSGELRLSNYLLWQLAYSEIYVTPTFWPDFDRWDLLEAILSYQTRARRFGGV